MQSVLWAVIYCSLLIIHSLPLHAADLPIQVKQALQKVAIPDSAVGVYIHEIGKKHPFLAVNANAAMNPASVMKLVTTLAGLELLGPAYTWQTVISAYGKIKSGVLQGDLVIKGYGDPKLDLENFWSLVYQLRQTGLYKITGNLVLDYTHYNIPREDPGAFDGQPFRTYNIVPEALLINYRTTTLHLLPRPGTNSVQVTADPYTESLSLHNNLVLARGQCGDWRHLLKTNISLDRNNNNQVVVKLNGKFSINCGKKSYLLGLHDSATYTRDLFKKLWEQQGGEFQGDVITTGSVSSNGLTPLIVYESPPLAEIIRGINKFSNNISARQLYLTLGVGVQKNDDRSPANLVRSEVAVKQWLSYKRLDFPELVIENGSGLSRKGRISAQHIGKLLLTAFQSPVMPEFIASIPIAGVDGTLKNRFSNANVSGMAHVKTGSLRNVNAVAGYILNNRGQRFVVVFFVNHDRAATSWNAIDLLLQWLYEK